MTTMLKPPRLLCSACMARGRLRRLWYWWLGDVFVCRVQAARDFSGYIGFEREDKPTTPLEQDPAASSSSSSPVGSTAAAAHDAARPDGEPRS